MIQETTRDAVWEFGGPIDRADVNRLLLRCRRFMERLSSRDCSPFLIVVRELLMNAIIHGNRDRRDLEVKCRIEHLGQDTFRVTVEDQGEGFNYGSVDMDVHGDPRQLVNRGYVLIKRLADEIRFNEEGNRVAVLVRLQKGMAGAPSSIPAR